MRPEAGRKIRVLTISEKGPFPGKGSTSDNKRAGPRRSLVNGINLFRQPHGGEKPSAALRSLAPMASDQGIEPNRIFPGRFSLEIPGRWLDSLATGCKWVSDYLSSRTKSESFGPRTESLTPAGAESITMGKKDKELRKKKARERKVAQRKIRERQERHRSGKMAELRELSEILLEENQALKEEAADLTAENGDERPFELERFQRYLWKSAVKAGYDADKLTDSQEDELLDDWESKRERLLDADPVEEAQDIMFEALEEGGDADWSDRKATQRVQEALIQEALELDPGNIDAMTLRAKLAFDQIDDDDVTGFRLLHESVRKAREALGPEYFRKYGDRLHSRVEAKPFLRALSALAEYYDGEHRFEEAFPALQELIGYLPPEETYFRRMHFDAALCLGRTAEARDHLSAAHLARLPMRPWAECLFVFVEGTPTKAIGHLNDALADSPYFPFLLLDLDKDEDPADRWTSRDRDRGREVNLALGRAWRKVQGAREWLQPLYFQFLQTRRSNSL